MCCFISCTRASEDNEHLYYWVVPTPTTFNIEQIKMPLMIPGHMINPSSCGILFHHFRPPSMYYPKRAMLNFLDRSVRLIATVLERHTSLNPILVRCGYRELVANDVDNIRRRYNRSVEVPTSFSY